MNNKTGHKNKKRNNGESLRKINDIIQYHKTNPLNLKEIECMQNLKNDLREFMNNNDIYRFTRFPAIMEKIKTESELKHFGDCLNLWREHVINEVKHHEF